MEKRNRRTQHQVWCDQIDRGIDYCSKDIDWVWYDGKIYKCSCDNHLGEFFLSTPDDKQIVHMDVDQIFENCYEVFEEEVRTLRVLFGKTK